MATLPVYMKYQFKLYPFLSAYSTILYWQSGDSFGMIWNRISDPTSLKSLWIQRAGHVDPWSKWYRRIFWCTVMWVINIDDYGSSSASSKRNSPSVWSVLTNYFTTMQKPLRRNSFATFLNFSTLFHSGGSCSVNYY